MALELRIASPCTADWDLMPGDERVRHCPECQLNVYNFSAMTKSEVDDLFRNRQGRLCARIFRRKDGTILTKDCPVGLRARVKRLSRIVGAALSAAISLSPALAQTAPKPGTAKLVQIESNDSAISLRVFDMTEAVTSKAQISLRNQATKKELKAVTNEKGELLIPHLKPGSYLISIYAPGFSTHTETISVEPKQTAKLDVTLELGLVGEVVEVPQK